MDREEEKGYVAFKLLDKANRVDGLFTECKETEKLLHQFDNIDLNNANIGANTCQAEVVEKDGQTELFPIVKPSQLTGFATNVADPMVLCKWIKHCIKFHLTPMIVTENKDWALQVVKSCFHADKILICRSMDDFKTWDDHKHDAFIYVENPIIYEIGQNPGSSGTAADELTNSFNENDDDEDVCAGLVQNYRVIEELLTGWTVKTTIPGKAPRVLISNMSYYFALEAWMDIRREDREKKVGRSVNAREKEKIRAGIANMLMKSREFRIGQKYHTKDQKFLQSIFIDAEVEILR